MSRTDGDKKYNTTLAGLYSSSKGNLYSLVIDPRNFDSFQEIEVGGKLFIRFLSDETKDKMEAKNGKKPPEAFLEYMDAKTVAEEEAAYRAKRPAGASRSPNRQPSSQDSEDDI